MRSQSSNIPRVMAMKTSLGTLAMAGALALALLSAPTLASAADFFGIPIPGQVDVVHVRGSAVIDGVNQAEVPFLNQIQEWKP